MDRKEIIKVLEQHFGVKAKYMGVPSFAYQIEINGETFTIDKAGKINSNSGVEIEFERLINAGDEEVEMDIKDIQNETENTQVEIGVPMEGHTGLTLRNLLNMIYSKQVLIKRVFELEEDIINKNFIIAINELEIQSIEDFKTAVAAERELAGIDFDFNNNAITFKFANCLLTPEKIEAYTQFVALLNKSARALKHVSLKPSATDNEKFTMRTWLLRLGFIGPGFKASRKILLSNLQGNGAFRKPRALEGVAQEQ